MDVNRHFLSRQATTAVSLARQALLPGGLQETHTGGAIPKSCPNGAGQARPYLARPRSRARPGPTICCFKGPGPTSFFLTQVRPGRQPDMLDRSGGSLTRQLKTPPQNPRSGNMSFSIIQNTYSQSQVR